MKIIVLFVSIFFLNFSVIGQESNSLPLKLSISLTEKQVCFGNLSQLIVRLTNTTKEPIIIDTKRIGYETNFIWSENVSKGNAGGAVTFINDVSQDYKPAFLLLKPQESYSEIKSFLFDKMLFSKPRNYRMQISYGQFLKTKYEDVQVWRGVIESNEISVFVKKCGKR